MKHNDYELVYLAQEGNEEAINLIYQKYKPIIVKKSKNAIIYATHHGIEINDIMQECYIALDEAIRDFSQDNEASFYTFAMLCIDRQIVTYLRRITGGRDKILNEAVTIDNNLERVLGDDTNLESSIIINEQLDLLVNEVRPLLTNFEKEVFDMIINNISFEEIAIALHKDIKAIYNAFQRIKIKTKKYITFDN